MTNSASQPIRVMLVDDHTSKLGVASRTEAVTLALRNHIIP